MRIAVSNKHSRGSLAYQRSLIPAAEPPRRCTRAFDLQTLLSAAAALDQGIKLAHCLLRGPERAVINTNRSEKGENLTRPERLAGNRSIPRVYKILSFVSRVDLCSGMRRSSAFDWTLQLGSNALDAVMLFRSELF